MQTGPDLPDLTPDCTNCAALCCVAYPFDIGVEFALSKDTDSPCPNLCNHVCSIHDTLTPDGFAGCVAYSCAGAGQRVTQVLFDGESWRNDEDLLSHMTYALRVLRPIHEALLILREASHLPIPPSFKTKCTTLMQALCPQDATSIWDFEAHEVQDALAEVPEFIPSLAAYVRTPH